LPRSKRWLQMALSIITSRRIPRRDQLGVRQFFQGFAQKVFSDMRIDIQRMLAEGDLVDCHFVLYARHTGEMAGIAPQGNPIRLPAISTFRIADGKLAEAWEIFDSASLLAQMRGDAG
jgi:predicted ester cyclase